MRTATYSGTSALLSAFLVASSCTFVSSEATPAPSPPAAAGLAAAAGAPAAAPAPPSGTTQFGAFDEVRPRVRPGRVVTKVGCLPNLTAGTLHKEFGQRIGPLIGWDNPHIYPLGHNRWLWLVQDAYLDYSGTADELSDAGPQLQNLAFVQKGTCFWLLHRGTLERPRNFEPGDVPLQPKAFYWPLGGDLRNGRLTIFWSQTLTTDRPDHQPSDGLKRHPLSTWMAVYDARTLERLDFRPAPNSGVKPQYGFAVASGRRFTYLFGNSNMLNLAREGGFWNGPHSATRMYLARVPRGRLRTAPLYRTANGWSRDPRHAVPISERFWTENTMQPRLIDGRWVAVTKVDGFWGEDIVIDVARRPWGPWRTVERFRHRTRYRAELTNSYQPILLPWRDPRGKLIVVIAENARSWPDAVANPPLYRPAAFTVDWPPPP